jgi:hypothetical protein
MASKLLRHYLAVGLLLALLGGAAVGITSASGASGRQARGLAGSRFATREQARLAWARRHQIYRAKPRPLPAALVRAFQVLGHASRAAARKASGPIGQFPGMPTDRVSSWGLAVGDATELTNSVGLNLWLVPGVTGTCMVWTTSNGHRESDCVPNTMVLAGEFSPLLVWPSHSIVLGLAPNGNATATAALGDGSSETSPVSSQNLYVVYSSQAIRQVKLKDSSGTLRTWNVPDGSP